MSKFVFSCTSDEGVVTTVECESDTWFETFPHYLNMLRGAGFGIGPNTNLKPDVLSAGYAEKFDFLDFGQPCKGCK